MMGMYLGTARRMAGTSEPVRGVGRSRRALAGLGLASVAAMAIVVPGGGSVASSQTPDNTQTAIIVAATLNHVAQAERDVVHAGGTVGADLSIINGFAAQVPASAIEGLRHAEGIASVALDGAAKLATYSPSTDAGSPVGVSGDIGAGKYWSAGYTGKGIGVAVLDSGVVPVPSLSASGKLVYGPDFSPAGYFSQTRALDTFGHGTFMAGLIAGRSPNATAPYNAGSGYFLGTAPDAQIISIKVADETGGTVESAIMSGIQWAVQHRNDSGVNIKVLNLSLGVRELPFSQDGLYLRICAEQAWKAGITVVASAGNDGIVGLEAPADDPYVIAVGAVDTGNTMSTLDDTIAAFSNVGDGVRNPDIAAPGTHIVSLRNPGSVVDATYGTGPGSVTASLMRGSGTSEAAAITSGAVALLLSERPNLTPDQVKATLKAYAQPLPNLTSTNAGSGALSLTRTIGQPTQNSVQSWPITGALSIVTPSQGGSSTPAGASWASYWTSIDWTGRSWAGPTWDGAVWKGSLWTGSLWTGSVWTGSVWKGSLWKDSTWQTSGWS